MGIKHHEYINITRANQSASSAQTNAIVNAWIQRGKASWATLASALRHPLVKRHDIADQIAAEQVRKTYNIELLNHVLVMMVCNV